MKFNLKLYLIKNWFILLILLLTVLYGFFGIRKDPWRNWEDSSVFVMLFFTFIIYLDGFFISKTFKDLSISKIGLFFPALITIGFMIWFIISNSLHEFWPEKYPGYSRWFIMLSLFITVGVLSWIDYQIGKIKNLRYIKLFYYSDLPITITFFVLLIYPVIPLSKLTVQYPTWVLPFPPIGGIKGGLKRFKIQKPGNQHLLLS